jgi:hypothetical protein
MKLNHHSRKRRSTGALLLLPNALAQKATERYIPLGASPGVSGKSSYHGSIQSVDESSRSITIASAAGTHVVQMSKSTEIWVDRSKQGASNLRGSYADCSVGRQVEIKFADLETRAIAEWIKVVAE